MIVFILTILLGELLLFGKFPLLCFRPIVFTYLKAHNPQPYRMNVQRECAYIYHSDPDPIRSK